MEFSEIFSSPYETSNQQTHITIRSYQSDLQILPPSLHDGTIVYAVNDYGINASGSECVLIFQIVWNLLCGSGRCEGSWKANKQDVLVLCKVREIVLLGWETLMQFDRW
jgi:hypothetical protein